MKGLVIGILNVPLDHAKYLAIFQIRTAEN